MFWLWIFVFIAIISSAAAPAQRKGVGPVKPKGFEITEYLNGVCSENNTWSKPTRPCEISFAIDYQCVTGLNWNDEVEAVYQALPYCYHDGPCQSPDFERTCFCQSQYVDSAIGCYYCGLKHGGENSDMVNAYDWAGLMDFMDQYCDPMVQPTQGLNDYILPLHWGGTKITESTSFSDPLGFKFTDVYLYYTPSLSGVKAWSPPLSTIEGWSTGAFTKFVSARSTAVTSATHDINSVLVSAQSLNSLPPTTTSASNISDTASSAVFTEPTRTPSPLPSLWSDTSASNKHGVDVCGLVAILSLVAIATLT